MRRRRRRLGERQEFLLWVKISACFLAVLAGCTFYGRVVLSGKIRERAKINYGIERELEDAKAEYEELVNQAEFQRTREFYEYIARNRLGLIYPGELSVREEPGYKELTRIRKGQ